MNKAARTLPNQRLRRERELRGWSQEDVARKIGAPDDKTVRRWESGKVSPTPYYRQKLCALYGKSVEELGLIEENGSPTWNVPYRRNPFFTGREDVLAYLAHLLTTDKRAALTQVISGLGGIGKTQTSVEYAYRSRDQYRSVLWVNAATRDTLISGFATLATLLHLPEKDQQDQHLVVTSVKQWLVDHVGWLLILDNADDLDLVLDFLPAGGNGHILLTTRAHATGTLAHSINLETMNQEEGTLLLLRRAKLLATTATPDQASKEDRAAAEVIVRIMDGLPLALDQAGAYIEETGCSLADYLDLYSTRRKELLQRRGSLPADHPAPVATTWSLSFQKVEQVDPAAADLLRLCAFLSPDILPEEIITEGAAELGPALASIASDPFKLNEAIEALQKFSLVRRDPFAKALSIHRLVQAVLRDGLDNHAQGTWAERTVRAVNCVFPIVEFETWPRCQRYLPQAQVCAALIEQWAMAFPEAAQLLSRAGSYLIERAQYAEAEPLLRSALVIRERVLEPEHPAIAASLNTLAELYRSQGWYMQAESFYQRALALREKAPGPGHPDTASTLHQLAELYLMLGRYQHAKPLLQRALSIQEKVLGPEHPDTAKALHTLAELYYAQDKYAQAEPLYQRALVIREQVLGTEHPDTAASLSSLAALYHAQDKYEQAEPLYQRALMIREQVLGPEHPITATILHALAA